MAKVTKSTEIWCNIPNKVGIVAGITKAVSQTRTNILATASWGATSNPEKGYFKILTSNNNKAAEAIKKLGYTVKKNDILIVELPNKPAAFQPVAQKIADAGININYQYATTGGKKGQMVLSTNNDHKAMQIIRRSR